MRWVGDILGEDQRWGSVVARGEGQRRFSRAVVVFSAVSGAPKPFEEPKRGSAVATLRSRFYQVANRSPRRCLFGYLVILAPFLLSLYSKFY